MPRVYYTEYMKKVKIFKNFSLGRNGLRKGPTSLTKIISNFNCYIRKPFGDAPELTIYSVKCAR